MTEPNPLIQKGKAIVVASIALVLLISLLNNVIVEALSPNQTTIRDGVRFVLSIVLCYFLYRGHNWARWTMGVLLGLGGFIAIPAAFVVMRVSQLGSLWMLLMGVFYLGIAWMLLTSAAVKAFLSNQRQQG